MKLFFGSILLLCATSALANESWVEVEIPQIDVAEYHRPYVAIWFQNQTTNEVHNIAVWYQLPTARAAGEEWLKDLRQWWRRSGRSLDMPVDAFTGATRSAGAHRVALDSVLQSLPEGDYQLRVEAVREVGGRELLNLDFTWPINEAGTQTTEGSTELGTVTLHLNQ